MYSKINSEGTFFCKCGTSHTRGPIGPGIYRCLKCGESSNITYLNLKEGEVDLLPIFLDIETSGLNPSTHSILQISAISPIHQLVGPYTFFDNLIKWEGHDNLVVDPAALRINQIDLTIGSKRLSQVLGELDIFLEEAKACFRQVTNSEKIIIPIAIGFNSYFDLSFLRAANYHHFHYRSLDINTLIYWSGYSKEKLEQETASTVEEEHKKLGLTFRRHNSLSDCIMAQTVFDLLQRNRLYGSTI